MSLSDTHSMHDGDADFRLRVRERYGEAQHTEKQDTSLLQR